MTRQAASVDELIGISETCICNIEAPDVIKPKKRETPSGRNQIRIGV